MSILIINNNLVGRLSELPDHPLNHLSSMKCPEIINLIEAKIITGKPKQKDYHLNINNMEI